MATKIGTHLLGNGVNLQPSYYNNGDVNFDWDLMQASAKIKTVRIEIEPGMLMKAPDWIAAAQSKGLYVIATYHDKDLLGSDDPEALTTAATWWKDNYTYLGSNFTINLMNEWGSHKITAQAYADAYNKAIAILRPVYTGAIIVDLPGWGQSPHKAYDAIKTVAKPITDHNIVLSAHIYKQSWNSYTGHFLAPADLDILVKTGKPCIVGEFGPVVGDPPGTCNWSACVDHAKALGFTVLGWAWNGDGGPYNMLSPSWNDDGTAQTFEKAAYFDVIYSKL